MVFELAVDKVFVIGLDSASPELLFDKFIDGMPNVRRLLDKSIYGPMESCIPAITIPAWMVMATGKTPGELGLYGFRHRKMGTYNKVWIAQRKLIKEKAIWDYLGEKRLKSVLVGIPPSYPPRPINGCLISCFITPDASVNYTYPVDLKQEIKSLVGDYIFDVTYRKEERGEVLDDILEMTKQHFEVVRYLAEEKEWSYFEFVEIGLDRLHHAFWRYFDEMHHLHVADAKYKNVIRDYYWLLDREIGSIIKSLDGDTAVIIVSDHGIKRMKGAFAINQWLIERGLLKIRNPKILRTKKQVRFEDLDVDWGSTVAWAWGGYYSRVFLNIEGREPKGIITQNEYEEVKNEIADQIKQITGPNGERWDTAVYYPDSIYPRAIGDKPDMMVYLDNLSWRAAGTLGYDSDYLSENDLGPDDAVHSRYGVFAIHTPEMDSSKPTSISIYDYAPTVLSLFNIKEEFRGKSII
ncbi:MAG: alkaline phosphatase family protein [Candidatus Hodarchaeota archaeon]